MQLTELLQVVHRQVVAGQVQQGVDRIEPWPLSTATKRSRSAHLGLVGVMAHMVIPQRFSDFRPCHGGAGVAGFGFFDSIHRKCTDGIGQVVTGCIAFPSAK